jgi:hypothetical protein
VLGERKVFGPEMRRSFGERRQLPLECRARREQRAVVVEAVQPDLEPA